MGNIGSMKVRKIMKIWKKIFTVLIGSAVVFTAVGCSSSSMTTHEKAEIPETKYKQAGYAVDGQIEKDGTVKITYALIGVKNKKIAYLYLDQIEQNPSKDRACLTNKELGSAYGLGYKSDHGEWNEQVSALVNYIVGNKMTINDVNNIPTEKSDSTHMNVPKKGSDLEAGCNLDITDFLNVINKAYNNLEKTKATRLAVGDYIQINNNEGKITATLGFVGTDYRYKICYSHLETFSVIPALDTEVLSLQEKATKDESLQITADGEKTFEKYIEGLNMVDAYGVETYDSGDGISTALPKKETDLSEVCNIDLSRYISVLTECSDRL